MNYAVENVHRQGEWTNLVVVTDRRFSIAWNGRRMARSEEVNRLCRRHPDLAESVAEWLSEGVTS